MMQTNNPIISDKINVLHLIESLRLGGAEIALIHYIEALGTQKYRHFVYTFGATGPTLKKLERLGLQIHFGPQIKSIKNPAAFCCSLLKLIRDVLRYSKANNINVIQSQSVLPNQLVVFIGKLTGLPVYPTVHSTNSFEDSRSILDPRLHLRKVVNTITYKSATKIIAVSTAVQNSICHSFNIDKANVIIVKNGIVKANSRTKKNEIKSNQDKPLKIIAVGRLVPSKCFDILIKAVQYITKSGRNNFTLSIIGDGPERQYLVELTEKMNLMPWVKLEGTRDNVIEIMEEADIFVLPSRYEGLSMAVIEAMSSSLPLIVSDAPGLKDCVSHGYNGLIFKTGDHVDLANSLIRLLDDSNLRLSLSKNAEKTFHQEYNMHINIKPLIELYEVARQ